MADVYCPNPYCTQLYDVYLSVCTFPLFCALTALERIIPCLFQCKKTHPCRACDVLARKL
jgi:hypothetical protein